MLWRKIKGGKGDREHEAPVCLPHAVREEPAHRVASAQRSEGSQGTGHVHI